MTASERFFRLYVYHFSAFLRFAFAECHPGVAFLEAWYIDVIADRLQGCLSGRSNRLILNLPPRYLKSFCASLCFPVWALLRNPKRKIIVIAGNPALSRDLRRRIVELVQSPRFRALFPHAQFDCSRRDLTLAQGGGISFGVAGQPLIGRGADIIVLDDPQTPRAASDRRARERMNTWFDQEVFTRLNKHLGVLLLVMQRLHQGDLCGYVQATKDPWTHLSLSAIALEDEAWTLSNGLVHTRKKGEPLHPEMESHESLWERAQEIGAVAFWAQYLQKPLASDNPKEQRWGNFLRPLEPGEAPGDNVRFFMGAVPEIWFLEFDVFGKGGEPPRRAIGNGLVPGQWERIVEAYKAKISAYGYRDKAEGPESERLRVERERIASSPPEPPPEAPPETPSSPHTCGWKPNV